MERATQTYHRLTSYEPEREWDVPVVDPRIVQGLETNDLERLPWFFKRYETPLPQIDLPREPTTAGARTLAVLAGRHDVDPREVDLAQIARLLFLSAGVVRTMERPYGTHLFRASGSAGGRFPLELYVAAPDGGALPPGVHWYHPQDHALLQIGSAPRGDAPCIAITGIPWRTGWRYAERGFRHIYWDAGTMLAQMLAAADSAGLAARLYTRFPDRTVEALVGADGMHEWPAALVAFGDGAPALTPSGPSATGEIDGAPVEFPLVTAAQHAGDVDALGPAWDRGAPVEISVDDGEPVDAVVLARGSQRRMDPTRGLSKKLLTTSLDVALRGIDLEHFVVVHDVEGLEPGIYRLPDLSAPARRGNLRDELYRVCLEQGLARDSAFVVISATDIAALDDREYREAHLAAGLVEGRLHLAAYALGASASGMTFIDSEIPGLLGAPVDALLFTCVGVPEYRSRPGGPPGAPTPVRRVEPRL